MSAGYNYDLRPLVPADAPALAALSRQVFAETYGPALPAQALANYLARAFSPGAVTGRLADPNRLGRGAWQADTLAGFASLVPVQPPAVGVSGRAVELERLYVARAHHGRGAGPALLWAALAAAAERRYETIWLYVWEQNARALAFYRKWGFAQVGAQDLNYQGVIFHDLVLERAINDNSGLVGSA
jgi:ribosomal protein S18 acetylase RimI-like enzyme